MFPERWQQIKTILEATLEQSPPDRSVYLEQLCGADKTLRCEVESLLAFENSGEETDVFETNCLSSVLEDEENKSKGFIGKQVGKYRIERELGAGGMGVVFLAERSAATASLPNESPSNFYGRVFIRNQLLKDLFRNGKSWRGSIIRISRS